MTDFNLTETAKWQQETDKLVGELHAGADKALAEAAARGFAAPPGATLGAILAAGQDVKGKLAEANGKIYDERRKVIFEQDLFAMELIVKVSKLAMELYAAELINALVIENAEKDAIRDRGRADVERLNAETDKRQVAIIQNRAAAEQRVTALKAQLVAAEEGTLVYETALINAQIATAEAKLAIIDSIYQVLAAEELVLEAENRRAATLTLLLAAQLVVAGVKREMIPFYVEKAGARLQLAEAIKAEIPIKKAIEELGYDRIELKDTEEASRHLLRAAENELEVAKETLARQSKATVLARTQASRLIQEYGNEIRASILAKKEALEKDGIDLRLDSSLARRTISADADKELSQQEVANILEELLGSGRGHGILENLRLRAEAHLISIKASGDTKETVTNSAWNYQWKTII